MPSEGIHKSNPLHPSLELSSLHPAFAELLDQVQLPRASLPRGHYHELGELSPGSHESQMSRGAAQDDVRHSNTRCLLVFAWERNSRSGPTLPPRLTTTVRRITQHQKHRFRPGCTFSYIIGMNPSLLYKRLWLRAKLSTSLNCCVEGHFSVVYVL